MKPVAFHPEAKAEQAAAARWYEERVPGLGAAFREEAEAAASRIAATPEAFGIVSGDIRRHRLHRFPFGMIYRVEAERVFILAVMHLHRDPTYWEHRA